MFFLNLTAGEFFTLLGALGSLTVALYLLDQAKHKRVVSTLKFWTSAAAPRASYKRRRVREPWSLVLQLVSLILLLLAIARVQFGSRESRGRDHVLLFDTSAWAAQRSGDATLIEREKKAAQRFLAALPKRDRVMLVRSDALAAPLSPFTSDRTQIVSALRKLGPGSSALNIQQALLFAQDAQRWSGGQRGEVVYIGPGMVPEPETAVSKTPNLRTIIIPPDRQHIGIRGVGVRRSDTDEYALEATVMVKNYGARPALARLQTQFAGTAFAPRTISLNGGEESAAEYNFVTHTAGRLAAEITPGDALVSDQRVELEVPSAGMLRVAVFTDRPEILGPLFSTNRRLRVHFFPASEHNPRAAADLLVFDRTAPDVPPLAPSIWIDPPRDHSPLPVKTVVSDTSIANWNSDIPLGAGLHAKDRRIRSAEVFQTFDGDITVANVAEGPIVVARSAARERSKMAVIGFDPLEGELRVEVTTPLLFANLLRWISPDVFRPVDAVTERVGAVTVPLDTAERSNQIRVVNEQGFAVPFLAHSRSLELFAGTPEVLRVSSENRERVLSITLPDVASFEWKPPANAVTGLPGRSSFAPKAIDLWKWLAVLGALGLFAEWMLFGRRRAPISRLPATGSRPERLHPQEELAAK
jgi:hypothetical protein